MTAAASRHPQARNQCAVQRMRERSPMKRWRTMLFKMILTRCAMFAGSCLGSRKSCQPRNQ